MVRYVFQVPQIRDLHKFQETHPSFGSNLYRLESTWRFTPISLGLSWPRKQIVTELGSGVASHLRTHQSGLVIHQGSFQIFFFTFNRPLMEGNPVDNNLGFIKIPVNTPPKTNMSPKKGLFHDYFNRKYIFQPIDF